MTEAIQSVINQWLIDKFTENMGEDSAYTTSQLLTVENAVLRVPNDWQDWELPALGISCRFVHRDAHMHPMRLEKQLVYLLTFVTHGEEAEAIAESETLLTRCEQTLLTIYSDLTGIVNDGGERAKRLDFFKIPGLTETGSSRLRKYADNKNGDYWFAAQDISIVFNTITGVS